MFKNSVRRTGELTNLQRIKTRIREKLEKIFPGLLHRFDLCFLMDTGKGFVESFLSDPISAYKKVVEYYGGDEESSKFIIYVVLRELLSSKPDLVDKAFKCIASDNYRCIQGIWKTIAGD